MENNSFTFSFKNFGVGALFFCAVFVIAFTAVNDEIESILIQMDPNGLVGRSIDSRNPYFYKPYDVLFLGDSRTNEGLDPNTFNTSYFKLTGKKITSYNAARPAMQSPFFYFIIKDYILQTKRPPKAVVVNGSFDGLWSKEAWIQDLWVSYYNPRSWQLKEALILEAKSLVGHYLFLIRNPNQIRHRFKYISSGLSFHYTAQWAFKSMVPFYRYRKRINSLLKTLITDPKSFFREIEISEQIQNVRATEEYLGYVPKPGRQFDLKEVDPFCIFTKRKQARWNINYMKKFFGLAKEYDFEIFVYGFPWLDNCKKYPNFRDRRQYYFDKLKEIAKDNPKIHFIEYSDYWSPEYFYNPLHLNHKGAQILTQKMVNNIHKHLAE